MSQIAISNVGSYLHQLNSIIPGLINAVLNLRKSDDWLPLTKKNPFRILGLYAGSSMREQSRSANRLKMFLAAGESTYEFNILPSIGYYKPSVNDLDYALCQLQFSKDRVFHSMFWFYHLKESSLGNYRVFKNHQKLLDEIKKWQDIIIIKSSTLEQFVAILNYSTYQLNQSYDGNFIDFEKLKMAVSMKLQLMEAPYFEDFQRNVNPGEPPAIESTECQVLFLQSLFSNLKDLQLDLYILFLARYLLDINFLAKSQFLNELAADFVVVIEKSINDSKTKRENNKLMPLNDWLYVLNNYSALLELIWGSQSLKLTNISNQISEELLNCGNHLFEKIKHDAYDEGVEVKKYYTQAQKFARGVIMIERCEENQSNFKRWLESSRDRKLKLNHLVDFNFLDNALHDFKNKKIGLNNAKNLPEICKLPLLRIKSTMGTSSIYREYCTNVVRSAINMAIEAINENLASHNQLHQFHISDTPTINYIIDQTLELFYQVDRWTMDAIYSNSFKSNFDKLKELASRLKISIVSPAAKLELEINRIERELREIKLKNYYEKELKELKTKYKELQQWQLFRSRKVREAQLSAQQNEISRMESMAAECKRSDQRKLNDLLSRTIEKLSEINSSRP